jgi:hypothetical protein
MIQPPLDHGAKVSALCGDAGVLPHSRQEVLHYFEHNSMHGPKRNLDDRTRPGAVVLPRFPRQKLLQDTGLPKLES